MSSVPRQHDNFFLNFDSKEILSILLWLLVNSILTTSLFIIWTSTIKFLIGPKRLVPNPLVYRLMLGSAWKFSTRQLARAFQTKLLLFLKFTAILIRTFICASGHRIKQLHLACFSVMILPDASHRESPPLTTSTPSSRSGGYCNTQYFL